MEAALIAAALNLHFVARFVGQRVERRWLVAIYAVALLFEVAVALGYWWRLETAVLSEANVFGWGLVHWRAEPTLVARVGFGWVGLQLLLAQAGLLRAARSGQREAYFAFGGGLVLVAAAGSDMLLASGRVQNTLYVAPHAFMLYAFSVASTLVFRYRRTIAELTRTERELRTATEQLSASHEELREVQNELTKKEQLAAVGELAAAIAHEVRNPLAIIGNAVAGLRRPVVADADRGVLLDIVSEEADRLNHLVTDLLRFARPTSIKRSRIDLIELIEHTQVPLGDRHVLEVHGDDRARFVEVDPELAAGRAGQRDPECDPGHACWRHDRGRAHRSRRRARRGPGHTQGHRERNSCGHAVSSAGPVLHHAAERHRPGLAHRAARGAGARRPRRARQRRRAWHHGADSVALLRRVTRIIRLPDRQA